MNNEINTFLNDTVASYGVFYIKLHQHHFYVQGEHFFRLHEKFEEMYTMVHEQFDEMAERLITIGGSPYASLQEFLDHSLIKEHPYKEATGKELVASTVADLRILSEHLGKGAELTGGTDDVTQDQLIGYRTEVDKHIWMLQAFLGKGPMEQ